MYTIYNELSNARNPNNMALIGIVFQGSASQANKVSTCKPNNLPLT